MTSCANLRASLYRLFVEKSGDMFIVDSRVCCQIELKGDAMIGFRFWARPSGKRV